MKEKNCAVKVYPFRFTPLIIAVLCAAIALCAACFALTTWQFVGFVQSSSTHNAYEWMKYILLYFVSVFLAVVFTAMLIRSQYVLTQTHLITAFGLIRSSYELKKIRSVCLMNGSNKLCLYFDDFKTKYMTIVVKKEWYDDFIKTITSLNEHIEFDFLTAEDEEQGKKK